MNLFMDSWLENTKGKLFIAEQYFHHHAFEIISTHTEIKNSIIESLNATIDIKPRIKKKKSSSIKAIEASFLNAELRKVLDRCYSLDLKFEVNEENGVFYFATDKNAIGGFDFAILNHEKNLTALRNLCFGSLHYHDGLKRWNKFLEKNPELKEISERLVNIDNLDYGRDREYVEEDNFNPLIVGEIQFGNWALAYRDFFKVLKADVQNSIDCLIYIVPTGNLESMLSDGIVTYNKTKVIINDFSKVISVPVWLIGLDMELPS